MLLNHIMTFADAIICENLDAICRCLFSWTHDGWALSYGLEYCICILQVWNFHVYCCAASGGTLFQINYSLAGHFSE